MSQALHSSRYSLSVTTGRALRCGLAGLLLLLTVLGAGLLSPGASGAAGPHWEPELQVATGANTPTVALDGRGNVHVAWIDAQGALRHRVWNHGWTGPATLVSGSDRRSSQPHLAADAAGRVHLVWSDGQSIQYALLQNGSWSTPAPIPAQADYPDAPQIALDEHGQPHVIFFATSRQLEYTSYYTRLSGGEWAEPRRLPGFVPGETSLSFLVRGGTIHMVFFYNPSSAGTSVGYTASNDGGATWSAPEDVAGETAPVLWSARPSLVLQEGAPAATWVSTDGQTGRSCSWYARRQGGHWTAPAHLVTDQGAQAHLVVGRDGDGLLVAWSRTYGSAQQVALANARPDPATGVTTTAVSGWVGTLVTLTADGRPDGEGVVIWTDANAAAYLAYHPPYRPSSAVAPLPALTRSGSVRVQWSGQDRSGLGIHHYDIQVRDGDGPWTDWQVGTALTAADLTVENGHTYSFRSRAVDGAGQVEAWPETPDASTTIFLPTSSCYLPFAGR